MLAQLDDLRASRARIVEAGDASRRRLEHDLHDGAQQRLLALSYDLRLALAAAERDGEPRVGGAARGRPSTRPRSALEELRELAHGIYPAVLVEAGSPRPSRRSPTPRACRCDVDVAGAALPGAVEAAAYVVVDRGDRRRLPARRELRGRDRGERGQPARRPRCTTTAPTAARRWSTSRTASARSAAGSSSSRRRCTGGDPVRVVVADDVMLTRAGHRPPARATPASTSSPRPSDADELLRHVRLARPDVAIVDIRMPPTHTDEGLVAAQAIRAEHPDVGVLVLSQYVEPSYAMRLLEEHPERVGYLLKERVFDVAVLVDALRRIADGETRRSTRRSSRGCSAGRAAPTRSPS